MSGHEWCEQLRKCDVNGRASFLFFEPTSNFFGMKELPIA